MGTKSRVAGRLLGVTRGYLTRVSNRDPDKLSGELSNLVVTASNRPRSGLGNRSSGFTLIELLTVISIIGIITTVITVNLGGARKQARDVRRKTDLQTLHSAVELFANAHGGKVPAAPGAVTSATSSPANPWIPGIQEYVSNPPIDPNNQPPFLYSYQSGPAGSKFQSSYILESVLEAEDQANANLSSPPSSDPATAGFYITGTFVSPADGFVHYRVSSGQ